mmetsp:Transcript_119937/g.195151  ORF Transcript_119937/g.195151 Transcript_119937/m.195151 type:complete len:206 (-) Transcript_119937:35-652(-)
MASADVAQQWTQDGQVEQVFPTFASTITPDYVRSLSKPTETFLCPLTANTKGIDFVNFKIRSLDEGSAGVLFEVASPEGMPAPPPESMDDQSRSIRYQFTPDFLDIKTIGTNLEFTIGDEPLHDFVMIERHYFRDQLITSYEFTMPFVIPGTRNSWEMIYSKPELPDEWKQALIANPWESRSDSFYFVEGQLVMHNRAEYSYSPN